ncbi:MAG: PBP1A family penicillin-binding protein [Alphaproteobacteria bacterium]
MSIAVVWGAVAAVGLLIYTIWNLPGLDGLSALTDRKPSISVVAADGAPLATYGNLYGTPAQREDLPQSLVDAVLATEDRRFYQHDGIDLIGIARAMMVNVRAGGIVQGGSTLTQQLSKIAFLTPDRTLMRKAQEAVMALWVELHFSKDEILTLYMNRVYLGAGAYGVSAAAQRYFGKPVNELTLPESAMLAGLLKAPSYYAPTRDFGRAKARTAVVLDNMVAYGAISKDEAAKAKAKPARLQAGADSRSVRYFTDWVLSELPDHVGRAQRDLTVVTTLDPKLQLAAEAALRTALDASGGKLKASQGAVLVMRPDGSVLAMVGGRDYQASQFNRAVQAQRQPGSAFKPIVYLTALQNGLRPNDVFEDRPVTIKKWSPTNFDGKYRGRITLADALANSVNTVAVRVGSQVGVDKVIATARRLGITSTLPRQPAIALGAGEVTMLELTTAYATLAAGGRAALAHGIVEVRDDKGKVVYRRRGSATRAADARAVADLAGMMRGTIQHGTGKAARLDRPAAGKTGTSQDYRDAWFLGFTSDVVAGVWVGNDDNSAMRKVTGGGLPARIWKQVMTAAHQGLVAKPLASAEPPPAGVNRPGADGKLIDRIFSIFQGGGSDERPSDSPTTAPAKRNDGGTLGDRPRPDGGQ